MPEKDKDFEDNLEHWHCEKCKIRIGVVDKEEQQIRVRYKDLVVLYDWKGISKNEDELKIICRRCAWMNTKKRVDLNIDTQKQKR